MGGIGSGRRNSKGKLRDVQCARLDVHELAREGKLKLGARGRLFGTIWFEVTGGPDARQLVLGASSQVIERRTVGALSASYLLPLAKSTFRRASPLVHVQRMPWRKARPLCAVWEPPHLVFQLPQMRWHHLSVHHGPSVGPFGASCREVARSAPMGRTRHRADQTARYA